MEPTNLTVKILGEIRDEVKQTNARLDQTNASLDQTNARLDQTNARVGNLEVGLVTLGDRIVESELRLATSVLALSGKLDDVKSMLQEQLDLRGRMDRCEQDITQLKERTGFK